MEKPDNKNTTKIERSKSEVGLIGTCVVKSSRKLNCDPESSKISKIITNLHFHQTYACIYIDNVGKEKKNAESLGKFSIYYR